MEFLPAPRLPDPPAAEVHVWRAASEAAPSSQVLLRVLARYLGDAPEKIELTRGDRGKPRLAHAPDRLGFNLGHSGELALIAVSQGREVGVDVERIKPERDLVAVAERAFAPEDAAAVRAAGDGDRPWVFYELWTRHEARLKCLGVGLGPALDQPPPPVAVETLPIDPGYAAAVAVAGDAVPIRCWTLD